MAAVQPPPILYYLAIVRRSDSRSPQGTSTIELSSRWCLDSFGRFMRGSYKEAMRFTSLTVAERTEPGIRRDVAETNGHCYTYGSSAGVVAVAITSPSYPGRVAQSLLSKILDDFTAQSARSSYDHLNQDPRDKEKELVPFSAMDKYIKEYQEPQNADSLANTQRELDETKVIIHKTIESVLERGEKIDNLVQKSEGLSASSKMFYSQAKKQNSCCTVM